MGSGRPKGESIVKKLVAVAAACAALAIPAAASAGSDTGNAKGAGLAWQTITGCTYGDIVNLVKADPNHPSIDGLGAKRALDLAIQVITQGGHPIPSC